MRDSDVRAVLLGSLASKYADDENTRIVEEMGVWSGAVRVDVAVINGELSGYELKSDRDTLARLPTQAEIYSKVFDRMTLVVGQRHAEKAVEQVPAWWGITIARQRNDSLELKRHRQPKKNPEPDPYLVAQLLWRNEALDVLKGFQLDRGWRTKRVEEIHRRLAAELTCDQLAWHVRARLKVRDQWLR